MLIDSPGAAFEVILGLWMSTKAGHNIQDLFTKFLLTILLEQTTAVHIANAFIKSFVCILDAS